MPCPYCGASLAEGARLCTTCGRLIAPRAPAAPPATEQQWQPGGAGTAGRPAPASDDPYSPRFDVRLLPPEAAEAYRQHRFEATFSILLVILVHLVTLGLASPFLLARKYAFLPTIRRDDFSTLKAAGFLFIPFFGLYWVFVVSRRIVDRLTLQARLWQLPGAPSKGLATALAVVWVLSAIPYLGLLFWLPLQFGLWPVYLAQLQRCCNRLALAAAPAEARAAMVALERATRLRWLGWMVLAPCLTMAATSLAVTLAAPSGQLATLVAGLTVVLAVAAVGGALLAQGMRAARASADELGRVAPRHLAAYLRIDKNAAWSVAWVVGGLGAVFLAAGAYGLTPAAPADVPDTEAWTSLALGATLEGWAAYAALRAVALRRQIAWLVGT